VVDFEARRVELQRQAEARQRQQELNNQLLNRGVEQKENASMCLNRDGPATMGLYCSACYAAIRAEEVGLSAGSLTLWENFLPSLPHQVHHLASDKGKKRELFEEVAHQYGLNLDAAWNKVVIRHRGRHPDEYHAYVLGTLQFIAEEAKGDQKEFLRLYQELVVDTVIESPQMLRKDAWWDGL
jgi:hypothetical protein